jgi:sugar O-acyltransferase (sialic acid O-acetyltransferase NeuD family)
MEKGELKNIILYGNGSVAEATFILLTHDSPFKIAGFTVDREYIKEEILFDLPVIPFDQVVSAYPPDEFDMHIAVGHVRVNRVRAIKYSQAKEMGYTLINYISTKSLTWPGLIIGDNCKIGPNSTINPFAQLGNDVRVGTGSNVGHHTILMDHCSLASNVTIAGNVKVGPYCLIGANATIRDRVTIGAECVIGAGAVILQDTKPKEVYLARSAELLPISSDKLPLG